MCLQSVSAVNSSVFRSFSLHTYCLLHCNGLGLLCAGRCIHNGFIVYCKNVLKLPLAALYPYAIAQICLHSARCFPHTHTAGAYLRLASCKTFSFYSLFLSFLLAERRIESYKFFTYTTLFAPWLKHATSSRSRSHAGYIGNPYRNYLLFKIYVYIVLLSSLRSYRGCMRVASTYARNSFVSQFICYATTCHTRHMYVYRFYNGHGTQSKHIQMHYTHGGWNQRMTCGMSKPRRLW